ncbi:MAG: PEP-CTERM sorting domain-containing protein [Proteobacteria bacterium]|nr:PEP-CTERM sorting domain-containing protein [Pseudomonadota bacterium]
MRHFLAAAAAAAVLGLAGAGQAATVTLNETIDLSVAPDVGGGLTTWRDFTDAGGAFAPGFSFDLAAGDTLDFTATFLAGQSLTLTNPSTIWLLSFVTDGDPTDFNATGSLELLDTAGGVLFASNVKTDTEGSVHFGQAFGPGDFASLPSTITIGGVRYVGALNDYEANAPDETPGVTSRTYGDPAFSVSADAVTANGVAVPEPAAWALMIAGFGGAGLMLRRRRVAATA